MDAGWLKMANIGHMYFLNTHLKKSDLLKLYVRSSL